ncbi:hypothetical protein [Spiroplasma culicicola]|uniref:hypothetical protein n=1 Tax=Spiroplasma culicicola TaxID=216935 RepID=UPI00046D1C78|nr:hypothetical protein [Spiroplasma culicicola]
MYIEKFKKVIIVFQKSLVTFISKKDIFVSEWLKKDTFNVEEDQIIFINFMQNKFGLLYDKSLKSWVCGIGNVIISMEENEIILFNKYISSYNVFIKIGKDKEMAPLTKDCWKLYNQQAVLIKEHAKKFKKIDKVLAKYGINLDDEPDEE